MASGAETLTEGHSAVKCQQILGIIWPGFKISRFATRHERARRESIRFDGFFDRARLVRVLNALLTTTR